MTTGEIIFYMLVTALGMWTEVRIVRLSNRIKDLEAGVTNAPVAIESD